MEMATGSHTAQLSLVRPHQVYATVSPSSPETMSPRVLELTGLLQTTLEIDEMVEIFNRELTQILPLDGLEYFNPNNDLEHKSGKTATHRATYDLELNEQSLGALRVFRKRPFIERELQTLENLLCSLVYPLRNGLAYRGVVERASRDPLTGVQNRDALNQALEREVDLAHRQGNELAVIVIDIDHFKQFNDRFGHSFGDEVLKTVAETASACVRTSDLLYRFGGEEFVVLASQTDRKGAFQLAERIRKNVEALHHMSERTIDVTVSLGVSFLNAEDNSRSLFDRADAALYEAKDLGRNRTVLS